MTTILRHRMTGGLAALGVAGLMILAPLQDAWAKPKKCFTKPEQTAEQVIRLGLRLREGALTCHDKPWNRDTKAAWEKMDQTFGQRFAQQTKIREQAFSREFPKDAKTILAQWDGRTVFFYRYHPLSDVYCNSIGKLLDDINKKGWGYLTQQAAKGGDEVKMDYRQCP